MNSYEDYKRYLSRVADLKGALALLAWDQETYMPKGSSELRSSQMATLSGLIHARLTAPEFGDLLYKLRDAKELTHEQSKNIELSIKDFEKKSKLPTDFVERLSKQTSLAFQAWQVSKTNNDYTLFEKPLADLIALKFEEADLKGGGRDPYDVLLDDFEPGISVLLLDGVFKEVQERLGPLVYQYAGRFNELKNFKQNYPTSKQWEFTLWLLEKLGFKKEYGRQDQSLHPFSISLGPKDTRITTRLDENDLAESIWSTLHECGHAFYEMGILPENYGLPAGEAGSLSIHESQSRLWENMVGRSLPFIKFIFPVLKVFFPSQLKNVTVEDFYREANKVNPDLIRTNADELTYHFHILIRYRIEKAIFKKEVTVKELPKLWNEMYREFLGVKVPNDQKGILQDVHWSHGSFGYFPTYSLGSFYAAQFYEQAKAEIPNLEAEHEKGNFSPLLSWLRNKIHVHGRLLSSEELCKQVTGSGLNVNYFIEYVKSKYSYLSN